MTAVDQIEFITAEELAFASQLGILRLMYKKVGTVNIAKSIRYGGKTVGLWVHALRVSIKNGTQSEDVNNFIKETDLHSEDTFDLTPAKFKALMESNGVRVEVPSPLLETKTVVFRNKELEHLLDTKEVVEPVDKPKSGMKDKGAKLKAKLLAEDRRRFAEVILRLLAIKAIRGNIKLPRKFIYDGWDATNCLDILRQQKQDRKLENWKVNTLNQLGMVWTRNYPLR